MNRSRKMKKQIEEQMGFTFTYSNNAKKGMLSSMALILVAVMLLTSISLGLMVLADSDENSNFDDTTVTEPAPEPTPEPTPDPVKEPGDEGDDEDDNDDETDPDDDPDEDELDELDDEQDEETEDEEYLNQILTGSISGFLWVDGDGTLTSHWDGIYNIGEDPLVGYTVYIYNAADIAAYNALPEEDKIHDNMPLPLDSTKTFSNGTYLFYDLPPGNYIIGLASDVINGVEYLLPMEKAGISVFEINWETDPLMAYSDVLPIIDGNEITDINAGMRLPMGIELTSIYDDILGTAQYNSIAIDGHTWFVLRHVDDDGDRYALLLKSGQINATGIHSQFGTTTGNNNYDNSALRGRINNYYTNTSFPTIKSMAVKPYLGDHASTSSSGQSEPKSPSAPTSTLASTLPSGQSVDIMFAPSHYEISSALSNMGFGPPNFPQRFYLRTSSGSANVWAINGGAFESISHLLFTTDTVNDIVAVWVKTASKPIEGELERYHVYEGLYPIGTFVDSFHWLHDAVNRCGINGQWSIVATEDDDLSDWLATNPVSTHPVGRINHTTIPQDKNIFLTSDTGNTRTITSPPSYRHLEVLGKLTIMNITLDGNHAGGGLIINGYLDIENGASIRNCYVMGNGGGINASGHIVMNGGAVEGNRSDGSLNTGGGINLQAGSTFIMNSGIIASNTITTTGSGGDGGGIGMSGGVNPSNMGPLDATFIMNGGSISGNKAINSGGAISASTLAGLPPNMVGTSIIEIRGGNISNNEANLNGGGIQMIVGRLTIYDGTINKNSAPSGGGVSASNTSEVTVKGGAISNNSATSGGGLRLQNTAKLTMTGGVINGNSATANGGGVHLLNSAALTMSGGEIKGNSASNNGGGIHLQTNAILTITQGRVISNTAGEDGGGIWTPNYANLRISVGAVFGKFGEKTANSASNYYDLWSLNEYIYAFQERYTDPAVSVYSMWGPLYSTQAYHPVNNYDINVIKHTVRVYYTTDGDTQIGDGYTDFTIGDGAPFKLDGTGDRIIPDIDGYVFKDWRIGEGDPKGDKDVSVPVVTGDMTIYLIYIEKPTTTLTVSKKIDDSQTYQNKDWLFTVYFFEDAQGEVPLASGSTFEYEILHSVTKAPQYSGTLTLDDEGSATFILKHNNEIVISGVPLDAYFKIAEADYISFDASYVDNRFPLVTKEERSTGVLEMTEDRRIDFTNKFRIIPDMSVASGPVYLLLLSFLAGTAGIVYSVTSYKIQRRRENRLEKLLKK